jgi:protein-S-isoprenylcysteine O-methyltransferase Ste14
MTGASMSSPHVHDRDPTVRVGGWLFKRRSWLPLPLVAAVVAVPSTHRSTAAFLAGLAIVVLSEAVRFWGVGHIGVVSRTRSDRLGPLIDSGPFAAVRNPLYIGNLGLWAGFAIAAGVPWLAPVFLMLLGLEYHAIVRWEERLLGTRLGDPYEEYTARVPRWLPSWRGLTRRAGGESGAFPWRATCFSERGTLVAIVVGAALAWWKTHS